MIVATFSVLCSYLLWRPRNSAPIISRSNRLSPPSNRSTGCLQGNELHNSAWSLPSRLSCFYLSPCWVETEGIEGGGLVGKPSWLMLSLPATSSFKTDFISPYICVNWTALIVYHFFYLPGSSQNSIGKCTWCEVTIAYDTVQCCLNDLNKQLTIDCTHKYFVLLSLPLLSSTSFASGWRLWNCLLPGRLLFLWVLLSISLSISSPKKAVSVLKSFRRQIVSNYYAIIIWPLACQRLYASLHSVWWW